jgi:hypothetical protein
MQGLSPIGTFFLRAVRSRSRSRFARLAAVAVITTIPVAAFAQEIASPPAGQFLTGPYDPVTGGNFQFVNELVGGSIFYSSGFLGESTIIGNVEAGFVWGGHEVFNRVGLPIGPAIEQQISAPGVTGQLDFHATMVGHVLAGTGYVAASGTSSGGYSYLGVGMAPHARLWSGAIATSYSSSSIGSFETTSASTIPVYRQFFQGISGTSPDVINSSFGGSDPPAMEPESLAIDALAYQNPNVTFVAAAGNADTEAVSAPGNVYNGITVGSVGGTNFRTPSDFSSRGAVDFYNPVTSTTVAGVRAAVDIAAPGELNVLAAYLGPTGGLAPLTTITQNPSPTDRYFFDQGGTSFASPTVAGGIALMKDAAKSWRMGMPGTALDSRVIKAVLMATSDRTDGWNNGQATVNGVVRTTQSLDWATGAGALDLETAGLTYIEGNTIDVGGLGGGTIGLKGWDYGSVGVNAFNDYTFSATLSSPSELQVSLNWFARGAFDNATDTGTRSAFANLDLQVWSIADGVFNSLVAESTSLYNNAEFLRFTLTGAGQYGLRVLSPGMTYDANAATEPVTSETYGLSWNMVVVPEPSAAALAAIGAALATIMAHRRRS